MAKPYFVTITLKPHLYKFDIDDQYDKTAYHVLTLVGSLANKITIVAELTKNFNVHYHCICDIESKRKFVNSFRRTDYFGFINVQEITENEQRVREYILKDVKHSYEELSRRPILIDTRGIIPDEFRQEYAISSSSYTS